MRLPKGSRAVVENESELEILLPTDARYRVVDIVDDAGDGANSLYDGSQRVYVLEIVNTGGA